MPFNGFLCKTLIIFPIFEIAKYCKTDNGKYNKNTKAKQEDELLKSLEFCDLMKKDCQALKEESQEAIRKAAINSAKLIKQTVENDPDLKHIYKCVANDDGTIELVKYDCTKTTQLSKQPEGSISCS